MALTLLSNDAGVGHDLERRGLTMTALCIIHISLFDALWPLRRRLAETARTDVYQLRVDNEEEQYTDSDAARLCQVRIMKNGPQTFRS